jgi:hypothetical protein
MIESSRASTLVPFFAEISCDRTVPPNYTRMKSCESSSDFTLPGIPLGS